MSIFQTDLTPPHMARAPKRTMGIKPPAHWLLPPPTKLRDQSEEELVVTRDSTVEKPDMYEDLKQLFFNSSSNSSSTVVSFAIWSVLSCFWCLSFCFPADVCPDASLRPFGSLGTDVECWHGDDDHVFVWVSCCFFFCF